MKKLIIKADFAFAHKGYDRREYVKDQVVEADDEEFIAVAVREGWAEEVKEGDGNSGGDPKDNSDAGSKGESEGKAKGAAPENKSKGTK